MFEIEGMDKVIEDGEWNCVLDEFKSISFGSSTFIPLI